MIKKKLVKKLLIASMSVVMAIPAGSLVYADTQALPNGTITSQNGVKYLTDSTGAKYSGWFIDSKEDWYYFNESDKTMKTGWHHDDKDGYWYYLNLSDGKMVTGWQTIEGKEYFFQPVRDMGNYHFSSEHEKWLYSVNSKVPYGAMYVNTTTPDGSKVDSTGAKVIPETATQTVNNNSSSNTEIVKNGWISENGSWHYYESGTLAKNKWLNLDGKWYYVLADGAMVSNTWKEIEGKAYYFGSDGALYVNTLTPDGKKVDNNGNIIVDTYANPTLKSGVYVDTNNASYKWWKSHSKEVLADSRINGSTFEMEGQISEYYPDYPGGRWEEFTLNIEDRYWNISMEAGVGGYGQGGGELEQISSGVAKLHYGENNGEFNVKVIDENTIEIDGNRYSKVD